MAGRCRGRGSEIDGTLRESQKLNQSKKSRARKNLQAMASDSSDKPVREAIVCTFPNFIALN